MEPFDLASTADEWKELATAAENLREFFPNGTGLNFLASSLKEVGQEKKPMEHIRRLTRCSELTMLTVQDLISWVTLDPRSHYHLMIDGERERALHLFAEKCLSLGKKLPLDPKNAFSHASRAFREIGPSSGFPGVLIAWNYFGTALGKVAQWIATNHPISELNEAK